MQPRADGAYGYPERGCDLCVAEVSPGKQKQHVPLLLGERGERVREREFRRRRIRGNVNPRERAQPSFLVALMATQEVIRDPEQPSPSLSARRVVALPCRERSRERFRCEVATQLRANHGVRGSRRPSRTAARTAPRKIPLSHTFFPAARLKVRREGRIQAVGR